jgi:hypothetical protein
LIFCDINLAPSRREGAFCFVQKADALFIVIGGNNMQRVVDYFVNRDFSNIVPGASVGAEIETSLVERQGGRPISLQTSQMIMQQLIDSGQWNLQESKGGLISALMDKQGNRICYELGRQNFEVVTVPSQVDSLLVKTRGLLGQLYLAAEKYGAEPFFGPVLHTEENLLIIPDARDATWLQVDGKRALEFLSRISAVQFTIAVEKNRAISCLNQLAGKLDIFLDYYPQHVNWLAYIAGSNAGYAHSRYGGPLYFESIADYARQLTGHGVITESVRPSLREPCTGNLRPLSEVVDLDIPMYLRSVWWHFRLKVYGDCLCIEVRPIGRRNDDQLEEQLDLVMSCFS